MPDKNGKMSPVGQKEALLERRKMGRLATQLPGPVGQKTRTSRAIEHLAICGVTGLKLLREMRDKRRKYPHLPYPYNWD